MAEFGYAVLIFALLWGLDVFDHTAGEVGAVDLTVLVLEHQELKPEQVLDDVAAEGYHVRYAHALWVFAKYALDTLIYRLFELIYLWLELSRLQPNRLLNKPCIIPTNCLQQIYMLLQSIYYICGSPICSSSRLWLFTRNRILSSCSRKRGNAPRWNSRRIRTCPSSPLVGVRLLGCSPRFGFSPLVI